MSDSITCPKCKAEIPLTEAISHQVEERLRAEFDGEQERLLAEQAKQLADKDAEIEAAVTKTREEAFAAAEAMAKRTGRDADSGSHCAGRRAASAPPRGGGNSS